jgi:hypothetical protein
MPHQAELLPGTLDLLILKAVSLGALHGYGVLLRIGQISGGALSIEQGALYPRSTGWKCRGCWMPSGAFRRTTGGPNFTG